MQEIIKGDYIINTKKGTYHYVESIEYIDEKFIYFTEDSKCFPSEIIKLAPKSLIGNFFYKLLNNEYISEKELNDTHSKMSEMKLVYILNKKDDPKKNK